MGSRIKHRRIALGLTSMALATTVGVTENAIQKIESGISKQPSFEVGLRIAAALSVPAEVIAGHPVPESSRNSASLARVVRTLRERRDELQNLGVAHAFVFGSVARGEDAADSDIDLMIDVSSDRFSLIDLSRVALFLQDALNRQVDVVTARSAHRDPRFSEALREAVNAF